MADEEEIVEGSGEEGAVEEQPAEEQGAEFIPADLGKPKSDVYTAMLVLAFVAFLVGSVLAGRELFEAYDVQFFVFKKQ